MYMCTCKCKCMMSSTSRHEMPTDPNDPLSKQNMKDRYYGVNDPVADKMMRLASDMPQLTPPDDHSITSLYVGGLEDTITEKDLRCGHNPPSLDPACYTRTYTCTCMHVHIHVCVYILYVSCYAEVLCSLLYLVSV